MFPPPPPLPTAPVSPSATSTPTPQLPSTQVPGETLPDIKHAPRDEQPRLHPARPSDASQIQKRLAELGYLQTPPDGKWGPRSARALQDFRSASGIHDDSIWDGITETRLFSPGAVRVPTPATFVGSWTSEPGVCGDAPPLSMTSNAAVTSAGRCSFDSVRRETEQTWRVTARCFVGGDTWPANIVLRLSGNQLTWASEKGRAQYYRCQN